MWTGSWELKACISKIYIPEKPHLAVALETRTEVDDNVKQHCLQIIIMSCKPNIITCRLIDKPEALSLR